MCTLQINPSKRMNFIDILKVEVLSDDEHVLLLYFKSRILRLSLKDISQFILSLQENMKVSEIKVRCIVYVFLLFPFCFVL
jgi:hypothetical protein